MNSKTNFEPSKKKEDASQKKSSVPKETSLGKLLFGGLSNDIFDLPNDLQNRQHELVLSQILPENLYFFPLDESAIKRCLKHVTFIDLSANEHLNVVSQRFYLVLEGNVTVVRSLTLETRETMLSPSYSFGMFDEASGLGISKEIVALEKSVLAFFTADDVNQLMRENPSFKIHVESLRRVNFPSADHHNEATNMKWIRRGVRLTANGSLTSVHIPQHGQFEVKDISIGGIYINGFKNRAKGETIHFTISDFKGDLAGTIARQDASGSGIAFSFPNESLKNNWLKYVAKISSQTNQESLSKQLAYFLKPLPVSIVKASSLSTAKLIGINEWEAKIHSVTPLSVGDTVNIDFNLPLAKLAFPVKADAKIELEVSQNLYQISFLQLPERAQAAITEYIDELAQSPENNPKLSQPSARKPILLKFSKATHFIDYYYSYLSQGIAVIEKSARTDAHQSVMLHVDVYYKPLGKHIQFELRGSFVREIEGHKFVVALEPFDTFTERKISKIISTASIPNTGLPRSMIAILWALPMTLISITSYAYISNPIQSKSVELCHETMWQWMNETREIERTFKNWELVAPECISGSLPLLTIEGSKLVSYIKPQASFPIIRDMVQNNQSVLPVDSKISIGSQAWICAAGKMSPVLAAKVEALDLWKDSTQTHFSSDSPARLYRAGDRMVTVDIVKPNSQARVDLTEKESGESILNVKYALSSSCTWNKTIRFKAPDKKYFQGTWKWFNGEFDYFPVPQANQMSNRGKK